MLGTLTTDLTSEKASKSYRNMLTRVGSTRKVAYEEVLWSVSQQKAEKLKRTCYFYKLGLPSSLEGQASTLLKVLCQG